MKEEIEAVIMTTIIVHADHFILGNDYSFIQTAILLLALIFIFKKG